MVKTSKDIAKLIVNRIITDGEVTISQLEARAKERGLLLFELYQALELIHRDKRVARTVKSGEIVYSLAKAKPVYVPSSLPPYPWPPECLNCHGKLCEQCFPFYDPETDTIEAIKEQNRQLKRHYEKEKAKRKRYTTQHFKNFAR